MNLKRIWQRNAKWIMALWCGYSLIFQQGIIISVAGIILWVTLLYFTAPGVFWTYIYFFPFSAKEGSKRAVAILEKAVSYHPLIADPYTALGILLAQRQQWLEATPLLEEAIRQSSAKARVNLQVILAITYRETENYAKALELLNELVSKGHRTVKIYYNFGYCYLKQKLYPQAQQMAEIARSLDLQAKEPVLLLGRIHFATGDYQTAKDDYEWAIGHTKWPVESYFWLGRCELELGQTEDACKHLAMALERIKEDPILSDISVDEAAEWLHQANAMNFGNDI